MYLYVVACRSQECAPEEEVDAYAVLQERQDFLHEPRKYNSLKRPGNNREFNLMATKKTRIGNIAEEATQHCCAGGCLR